MANTPSCGPPNQPLAIMSPCEMLPLLRGALFELLSGKTRTVVRFNDRWSEYARPDVNALRAEIASLAQYCNADGTESNQGRAVQAGPRRPLYPFGNGNGPNRYRS
jgi:hypothetical protein